MSLSYDNLIVHAGASTVFELPGGWEGWTPYLILPNPLPLVKIRPRG